MVSMWYNILSQPRRVVVVEPEPLLEARRRTNSARLLTVYGNPGSSYQTAIATDLLSPNWQAVPSLT